MAKLSVLQIVNTVLQRIGEASNLTVLTALSQTQQDVFDNVNRALEEIAQDSDLLPLEAAGTVTLVTNTSTYAPASDYRKLAQKSVRSADTGQSISVITADEFNQMFPAGVASRAGYPQRVCETLGVFQFDKTPTAAENAKIINYRYFKIPTIFATATPAGTCYIPEGYDRTLLCDYVTWLMMQSIGHPEVGDYYIKVFGDPSNQKPEGGLSKFKRAFTQPHPLATFTAPL